MRTNNRGTQTSFAGIFRNIDANVNSRDSIQFVAKVTSITEDSPVGEVVFQVPGVDNQSTEIRVATPKDPNSYVLPPIGS